MTTNETPQEPEGEEQPVEPQETPQEPADDAETFPRAYVEQLRQENGKYRQRAQKADTYAQQLHTSRVAATGRLQDPTDLPYDEAHLESEEALSAAIDALLQAKPHLASGRPKGSIGQGLSDAGSSVDLAGMLRVRA